MTASNGSCRLSRIGARRPRPEAEAQCLPEEPTPMGGSPSTSSSSLPRRRRGRSTVAHPALLMAAAAAAALPAALLLLLVTAVPEGRAFVPSLPAGTGAGQQPQRPRHRPHASVPSSSDMLRPLPSSPSQPPGGSSSPHSSPGSTATSPSASAASLAPPPSTTRRRGARLEQHQQQPSSSSSSVSVGMASHVAAPARPPQQLRDTTEEGRRLQEAQERAEGILAGPVVQVLVEELPSLCLEAAIERAPRLFRLQDASALRRRLQALKAALPGGVNVTHAILEAPRLATYYGRDAAAMEAAVGPRFRALCEATGTAADAAEIVNRWPRVLLRDFATRVRPHLEAIPALLPGCDAAYLLRKHPAVLGKSVEAHLRPRVEAQLPALFPADAGLAGVAGPAAAVAAAPGEVVSEGAGEAGDGEGDSPVSDSSASASASSNEGHQPVTLGALAVNYPELLTAPLAPLRARVEALTALLPPELLLPTLSRHPRAWTADLGEEVGPQVKLLRARLGEATARAVLLNLPSAMYHTQAALERRLGLLETLLGPDAHAVLALNPMILAVDAAAHIAPKVRYLRALFDPEVVDDASFHAMLATEAGAKCLTAAFGRLGRLSYLLSVQPGLDLAAGLRLCVTSSEELRRRYPGYENFLEDRIEPRFPNYTWEQLCALPFAMREQAHGEILHRLYSLSAGADGDEEDGSEGGGGFFEPIDPLALLDGEE